MCRCATPSVGPRADGGPFPPLPHRALLGGWSGDAHPAPSLRRWLRRCQGLAPRRATRPVAGRTAPAGGSNAIERGGPRRYSRRSRDGRRRSCGRRDARRAHGSAASARVSCRVRCRCEEGAMLHTRLCDLLGITHPILNAPMAGAAGAELAAAVSGAGGFGLIGARPVTPPGCAPRSGRCGRGLTGPSASGLSPRPRGGPPGSGGAGGTCRGRWPLLCRPQPLCRGGARCGRENLQPGAWPSSGTAPAGSLVWVHRSTAGADAVAHTPSRTLGAVPRSCVHQGRPQAGRHVARLAPREPHEVLLL